MAKIQPKLIAFYLPQYHPIPENDSWWGKGFTEWTNVARAKPLFKGHYQPHIPADLGFYDLRVPETRQAQAELAQNYGIEGFCYYHYWFSGKRLLERPFNEVLKSGKPDFPFCLCWANESWTGIWHGAPNRLLIEQQYPGVEDYKNHFNSILPALKDNRAIKVDGKPLFILYHGDRLPNPRQFTDLWRDLAVRNGLKGIYLAGIDFNGNWDYKSDGFDGAILNDMAINRKKLYRNSRGRLYRVIRRIIKCDIIDEIRKVTRRPLIFSYKEFINLGLCDLSLADEQYPSIIPNWDNTPRSNSNGMVLKDPDPEVFSEYLLNMIRKVQERPADHQIIFIKSWNEWAEGNYLEPDKRFDKEYLQAIKKNLQIFT